MVNCIHCGVKRNNDSEKFCLSCGAKFEEVVAPPQQSKKMLTPKQKKARMASTIALLVLIAALVGTHFFLKWKYDASRQLTEMNQSFIKSEDAEFLTFFTFPESTKADAKSFYTFVEEEGWEDIREELEYEISLLEEGDLSNILKDSNGNKFLSVTNDPLLFGLYDRISINIVPIEVQVKFPVDEVTLSIDGISVTGKKGQSESIGNFLPGFYDWQATVPSDIAVIEDQGEMIVIGEGKNKFTFDPVINAGMVSITSDVPEAILWINGKSTEKTVKATKSIGPIAFDKSVQLTAETRDSKGAVLKAEEIAVDADTIHLKFDHVQKQIATDLAAKQTAEEKSKLEVKYTELLSDYINNYRDDFEYALNYKDFSYISSYFPVGSEVQSIYMKEIENHAKIDGYFNYEFLSNFTTSVKAIDTDTVYLTTEETFYFYSDKEDYYYEKSKGYTVDIINDEFYITNIEQLVTDKEILL